MNKSWIFDRLILQEHLESKSKGNSGEFLHSEHLKYTFAPNFNSKSLFIIKVLMWIL